MLDLTAHQNKSEFFPCSKKIYKTKIESVNINQQTQTQNKLYQGKKSKKAEEEDFLVILAEKVTGINQSTIKSFSES